MSAIQLPVQNKLELALISYLWTFGGILAPAFLANETEYLDAPAFFTPNPLGTGTVFDGLTWYPGHWDGDMTGVPRVIVACTQAGGDLTYAGYDACLVEVLQLSKGDDAFAHAQRHNALRAILSETQLAVIQAVVNSPATEPDLRAIQGFGLDSLVFKEQTEGRDKEAAQHGTKLTLECVAHLELS